MSLIRTLSIVLILFSGTLINAQTKYTSTSAKAIKHFEEGRSKYRMFLFDEAENSLNKAIKSDENFIEAYMVLAKLYWDIDSIKLAIATYEKGLEINPAFYPNGYIYKANLESMLGDYVSAAESFRKLLQLNPRNEKLISLARRGLQRSEFAIEAVKNPVDFNPIVLDSTINTRDDEYWPSLSADEQTIVITRLVGSSKSGTKVQEDFYISEKQNGKWTTAKNVGKPLNTSDNEGAQSISANGAFMVYTVCNRRGVIGRCDLYSSEKKGTAWSTPVNMGRPINSTAKETQPCVSADGSTIYFVSNRAGGKGGSDIWFTKQSNDGRWSTPENLGDSINTPGNETSPFIHHDNKTLYFSSDFHLGMGRSDIFISRFKESKGWTKAKNIGYPINTHRDEIGLVITAKGDKAYYSSNINPAKGRDIYQFDLYKEARPREVSYMKGNVFDARNRKALKAGFELIDLANGKLVSKSYSDPYTGEFLICIPSETNYMLNVSKEGYLFFSENFSLEGIHEISEPFLKDVPLHAILKGGTIILKNIFFETDAYTLKKESQLELNKLVSFLEINATIKIEISGHTDNVGTKEYNQNLSEKRAESVVKYLIDSGIESSRLVSKGYGLLKPIESNETNEGRATNRRTELTILE